VREGEGEDAEARDREGREVFHSGTVERHMATFNYQKKSFGKEEELK